MIVHLLLGDQHHVASDFDESLQLVEEMSFLDGHDLCILIGFNCARTKDLVSIIVQILQVNVN